MRAELDKQLCEKYPEIFKDRHAPVTKTAMCWGFECDDGWYDIIDQLCAKLMSLGPAPVATQVKEKYGSLHFYAWCTDAQQDAIDEAEKESLTICEVCGKPGVPRGNFWIKTLCDEHQMVGLP